MSIHEIYLGDGVYARFDGFQLTLWTDREEGRHWLAMEPLEWQNLVRFMAHFKPREDTE